MVRNRRKREKEGGEGLCETYFTRSLVENFSSKAMEKCFAVVIMIVGNAQLEQQEDRLIFNWLKHFAFFFLVFFLIKLKVIRNGRK